MKKIFKSICSMIYKANFWYDNTDTRKRELPLLLIIFILIALKPIVSAGFILFFLFIRGIHYQGLWLEWSDEVIDAEEI